MRNVNHLNAGQRVDMTALIHGNVHGSAKRRRMLTSHPLADSVASAMDALAKIEDIVADGCFNHPDELTQDKILTYALALLRVRECAGMAGMERLMNACDALAVTVSRLIDDRTSACHAKCAALTQFVTHAREMILASTNPTAIFSSLPHVRQ